MWFWVFILSLLYTEFVGYLVHRWLHTEQVKWLSDLHMEHHIDHYPPGGQMVSDTYCYPKRATWVERIGLEWIIPVTIVTIPFATLLLLFGVGWQYVVAGFIFSLLWAVGVFNYMHSVLHLKKTWWEKNYIFGGWFKETRKIHFVHHNDMKKNFGIAFFWFDKIYETFARRYVKDASLVK